MWTLSNLLRIAHSAACADLSDLARSNATTYGDGHARGGELVEEAERLVRDAEDVRLLAVATERSRGVSWEAIGEALGGVSKQAAQKRFSERVEQVELDVLLPDREGPDVGAQPKPGWTAGPDAAAHPDEWLPRLDAWAKRHHERTDGGKDVVDRLISHGLREPRALDHMSAVTKLTTLLFDGTGAFASRELPPGVTERYARRRLLEAKLALYDAMRADSSWAGSDAGEQAAHAFVELVALRTEEVHEILTIRWRTDDEATIALRERPVAILARSHDRDPETRGWWLWGVDDDGHADDRGGAWPELVDDDLEREREHIEHVALTRIAESIGSDQAKGTGPFDPGGIAGPDAVAPSR